MTNKSRMAPLRLFRLLLLLIVAISPVRANTSLDADSQLWNQTRITYALDPKVDIFAAGAFRLTRDFSAFTRVSGRAGLTWTPLPQIGITPYYLYTVGDPATSDTESESRLCLLTTYAIPISTATLTLGNTTEYRIHQDEPNAWWVRPRLKISHPLGPKNWELTAFVTDELFCNTRTGEWTRNRAFAGFEKEINKNLSIHLYYCRQTQMSGPSPSANAIGCDIRITFGKEPHHLHEPDLQ